MNYALLLNEEILLTKPETIDLTEEARTVSSRNIFDAIIGSEERELSKQRRRLDRASGKTALENLSHAKFLTAGQLFGMSTQLGQKGVVDQVTGNVKIREALETKKVGNKQKKTAELHRRVHAVRAKSDDYMTWTIKDELAAMLQYYKVPGDKKMEETVVGRREQWLQRQHRHPLALLTLDHIETYLNSLLDIASKEPTNEREAVAALGVSLQDATSVTI